VGAPAVAERAASGRSAGGRTAAAARARWAASRSCLREPDSSLKMLDVLHIHDP